METLKHIKANGAKEAKPEQPPTMFAMVFSRSGVKIVKNQKNDALVSKYNEGVPMQIQGYRTNKKGSR
jgi:hypothetical protein